MRGPHEPTMMSSVVATDTASTQQKFTARAGNRRFRLLSAPRAHTKAPCKTDLHRKTLRNAKGASPPPGGRGQRCEATARVSGGGDTATSTCARPSS